MGLIFALVLIFYYSEPEQIGYSLKLAFLVLFSQFFIYKLNCSIEEYFKI